MTEGVATEGETEGKSRYQIRHHVIKKAVTAKSVFMPFVIVGGSYVIKSMVYCPLFGYQHFWGFHRPTKAPFDIC